MAKLVPMGAHSPLSLLVFAAFSSLTPSTRAMPDIPYFWGRYSDQQDDGDVNEERAQSNPQSTPTDQVQWYGRQLHPPLYQVSVDEGPATESTAFSLTPRLPESYKMGTATGTSTGEAWSVLPSLTLAPIQSVFTSAKGSGLTMPTTFMPVPSMSSDQSSSVFSASTPSTMSNQMTAIPSAPSTTNRPVMSSLSSSVPTAVAPGMATATSDSTASRQSADELSQARASALTGGIVGAIGVVFIVFVAIFFIVVSRRRARGKRIPDTEEPPSYSEIGPPLRRQQSVTSSVVSRDPPVLPPTRPVINPFLDQEPPPPVPGLAITTNQRESVPADILSPTETLVPTLHPPESPILPRTPATPPPALIQTSVRFEDEVEVPRQSSDLPPSLGRLNAWLDENRRRSRVTASSASVIRNSVL